MRRWRWWALCAGSLLMHWGVVTTTRVTLADPAPPAAGPYGELIFLGTIAPPLALRESPPGAETLPQPAALPQGRGMAGPPPADRPVPHTIHALAEPWPQRRLPPELFAAEKPVPHAITTPVAEPPVATAPVWIRGPARWRELLHQPPLAPYLARVPLTRLRARELTSSTEVHLRFTLAPNGQVDHVDLLRSSGDPLLDLASLQYLKDWRFAAVDQKDLRKQAMAWGQVTLRLESEPSP